MQGARRLPAGRTYISSAALDSTRRVPVNPLVGGGGFGVRAPGYCRAPARRRVAGRGLRKTDSGIGPTGREGSLGIAAVTSPPPRRRPGPRPPPRGGYLRGARQRLQALYYSSVASVCIRLILLYTYILSDLAGR